MPKFLVELEDGKKFQVEADQQPSPEEISQYLGGQTQPEKPFFDLSETASSLGRAVTSLPTTTMASLSQAWEGLENPWKRSEGYLSRRQEMQALQDELAASEAEAAASGDASTVSSAIREATPSLGFSGATLLPSITAGAGTLALSRSPNAARAAAAATSGLMAYRMAGAQFLDDAKERIDAYFQENVGRAPNEQEQAEAYQELLPLARKFGAAEAGPEALGNLALGGAGKYIRRALGGKGGIVDLASNALGKVTGTKAALAGAGALASEVGTEGVTKVEQDRIQKQFEEGIMRGESPESVALADRSLGDYTSALEEVAPATIATVGMMGAAGLGPKAISRGIQALRPKPPVEQIVEEPSMPDPAEVAKTIGEASVKNLAATGNKVSAAAQKGFNAILDGTLGKTPEPTIQPKQAVEEVGAEVTPLSEGAERNRAIIAEAAAKLRGEAPKTISAGVKAAIPQQPVETQENAPPQIPLEESLRQEPQDRIESREAEETSAGDQLLSPAEGEGEGEVAPIEPTVENIEVATPYVTGNGGQRGEIQAENGDEITVEWRDGTTTTVKRGEVVPKTAVKQITKNKTQISQTSTSGSDLFTVFYFDENGEEHNIGSFLGETEGARDRAFERALALAEENARKHNHANVYYREKKLPVKKSSTTLQKTTSAAKPTEKIAEGEEEVITPPGEPTPATKGMVTPGGVATERDLTKVEQPTVKAPPEGKKSLYQIRAAEGRPATDADGIPTGWKLNEFRDAIELVSDDASKYVVFPIENPSSYGDKLRALATAENWAIDNPVRAQIEAAPMEANYGAGRVEDVTPKTIKFVHTTKTKPGKGQKTGYYPGTYAYESESGFLPSMEGNKFVGELPESDIYTLTDADQLKKDAADAGFGKHSGNGNAEVKYLQSLGFKAMRRPSMGGTEIIVFDTKDANFQPQTKQAAEKQDKQTSPKKAKSAKLDESKAIAEYPDLETFFEREIFPSGKKGGWVLKEKRTGARLSSGKTKEEASAEFRKSLLWQQAWNEEYPSVFEMVNKLIEDKSINAEKYSQSYKVKPSKEEWLSILEGRLAELRQDREDTIKRHRSVGSHPNTEFVDNFIADVEARLAKLQPTAAEMPTPDSVAVEPGATRGVQAEPPRGSILEVEKVSPETESESRENLGPEVAAAEQKQAADDEAAKKRQKKQDESTKNSLNSILDPQKKNAVTGTVTKADVETAREALTNSGEIPNAYLTNVYESVEAFLADKANARLFPSAYARLQTEKNIEGLYENGQTLIFAKQIQVSNLDRNLAKMLGVSDEQAAARRVIAHENGHKAISLFTMAEKRELRGYLMRAYSDEQIAKLVETYTEYADWRTNPESRFEALEELLMRDFEKMERIPTGGVWDDIVQFLKRVWRRLTGQKGEPTLKNLKDVARLMRNAMKRPAVPLGSFRLKDGGEVKLSMIAPTAGITPEMDAEYLAAVEAGDMEKAQRMVDEAAAREAGRVFYGGLEDTPEGLSVDVSSRKGVLTLESLYLSPEQRGKGFGSRTLRLLTRVADQYSVPVELEVGEDEAGIDLVDFYSRHGFEMRNGFMRREPDEANDPVTRDDAGNVIPLSQRFQTASPDIRFSRPQFSSDTSAAFSAGSEAARSTLYSERDMDIREAIRRAYEAMPKTNSVAVPIGELFAKTAELIPGVTQEEFSLVLQDLFEDNAAVLQEGDVVEPLTEQDRRYLALAEDEDANREELQRMVDEAAKATGLNVSGVGNGITYEVGDEPDSVYGERDNVMSHGGTFGFYFSDNPDVWSDYAKPRRKGEKGRVNRTFLSLKKPFRFSKEFVSYDELQTLLRDGGIMLPVEVKSRLDRLVAGGFGDTQPVWKWLHPTHVGAGASYGESLKKAFTDAGYDGVIHPDSSLMEGGLDTPATSYVVFSPSQIKSADPVTRDDQGNVIPLSRRFDTGADIRGQINVTTPEGKRAGFVVVMPRAAKASKIPIDEIKEASKPFKEDLIEASKGREEKAAFKGNVMRGNVVPDHNVNATELYKKAANDLLDSLLKNHDILDVAESVKDPDLQAELGMQIGGVVQPEDILNVRQYLGALLQRRLTVAISSEKNPRRLRQLEMARRSINAYSDGASGGGTALNNAKQVQNDPELKGDFFFSQATREKAQKAKDKLDAITGGTEKITDIITGAEQKAAEETTQAEVEAQESSVEDDQDAIDLAAGEETLDERLKRLYGELKDWLRTKGAIVRARAVRKSANAAKASLSKEQRDAIMQMSDEELDALEKKADENIERILNTILGKESDAKTPEQKKTRAKRKKMVDTAKKRAEAGKEIEVTRIQIQSFMDELMPGYTERESIVNEVGDALLKAAEQRKAKPRQRTAIQDFVSAIKQTLMANIRGDKISAEQPSLGMLLAKTFAQQGSEAEAFAAAWANGRKKVRGMLAEMGVEEGNLDAELDAIMPPTPTLAYSPAAARKAISSAMREAGLMRSDLLNDPAASKKAIMEKFDEAAKSANLTEEGWDKKGRALAEKAVDESIAEAKMAQERAKKVAKILSEQAEKPVSLEDFGAKLAEFRFKKDKIAELFNRAKKLAERKIQMANDQAIRVLLAAENKLAQSAFFNASEKPDTIVKAFREQVEEPMEREAFKKRMEKMLVTPEMADKLFDKAARERDNALWKKAQDLLEGPKALGNLLREMNKARPADSVPLERAMPWRKILSSKPKDVAEYRQRIFEAISDLPSFQNLTDEQKERLADLYTESWEARLQQVNDRVLREEFKKARDRDEISDDVEKKLQQSRNKILEIINLGGFNNDDLIKILGERYGISTEFTEEQKARIQELADQLQDETLNPAKRNKLAMEFAVTLAGASEIPVAEIIANWWTSSVLFGPQTIFSIGAAFLNGGYNITTIGLSRMIDKIFRKSPDIKGAIEESILMLQGIAKYLGAFKQAGRRAWSYLWTGNVDVLGADANDILGEINSLEELKRFKRHKLLAENLAKDPRALRRYVGMYLRFVNRLLTSLDAFNVMVTKAGTASLALRMSGMSTDKIIEAEKMLNLKAYKDQVIRDYFDNKAPKTQAEKALVDSYAEAEMYRAINKLGGKMENADYLASESAMTMNPTGLGGFFYRSITGLDSKMKKAAEDYLEKAKKGWITDKNLESTFLLGLAYLRQFAVQNLGGVAGYKFIRFASNKFNQGISYLPMVGLLRTLEAKGDDIKGKEAFIETIHRNQVIGAVLTLAAIAVVKALEEEPDDEERGNFWNGGWQNLTPDQKKQMLAKGQKEYTMGFKFNGRWYVFNYQNWPLNQVLAAIGSMSDQIRFSPKQWEEKGPLSKSLAGIVSGLKSTLEIPALSQLGTLVGNRLASKDPTEQTVDRLSNVAAGWVGGFVPRILKDLDFATQPELRKYKTLWEKTASHIPIYRRYVGEDYYDILGQPIKRNVIPGSREFMMGPTEPEYKILGALNSRNIFLTPANAEYRMVGKGRNRRRLTQEEADAYSLETGKGYRQMLLRYGQRALQMPTERARAFLSDKADEVRDRALKKVFRR